MLLQSARATGARVAAPLGVAVRPRSTAASPAPAPATVEACPAAGPANARSTDWDTAKPFLAMPGPKPLPFFGNLPRFLPVVGEYGKLDFLDLQLSLRKTYGDIVRVSKVPGRGNMVWVFDPTIVEKMYRNEGKWPVRDGVKSIDYYRRVERNERFGDVLGTVTTQGKEWYDFRSKVNQPLMQRKSANRYFLPVNDVAEEFISRMRELRDENNELPGDFINDLYKWALESITLVALDTRLGCLAPNLAKDSEPQRMIDSVQVMLEGIYKLDLKLSPWRIISTPMWRRMVGALDYFSEVADRYIKEALAKKNQDANREPSILQKLMAEDPRVANVMATDLLFGGVDTTSHTAASLLFHLAKNPEAQKKLNEEVRSALPSPNTPVTEEVMNKLPYLKACLKESLRIFPIAGGNSRKTITDVVLGGYQVPKGTDVMLCHMVMSRDEKHYPRALSFEPERWLRENVGSRTAHPFVTQPFGFGPRMCIGRRFAEMEVQTLVAKIIRNFWVEYHHGDELKFTCLTLNTVTLPLKFRLTDQQ